MLGTLSIVATPIGNLADMTFRGVETLKSADVVVCETPNDTRRLLSHFEIRKPLLVWRQRSKDAGEIIEKLRAGESLAYVTCAGTPNISDPGGKLVEIVNQQLPEAKITQIPGPSAVIAALSVSGVPADEFCFFGFPPSKKGRRSYFADIANYPFAAVFYEGPHRVLKSLRELEAAGAGERHTVVCRELTKVYESIYRGTLVEVIEKVAGDPVRGEYTVVIGPQAKKSQIQSTKS